MLSQRIDSVMSMTNISSNGKNVLPILKIYKISALTSEKSPLALKAMLSIMFISLTKISDTSRTNPLINKNKVVIVGIKIAQNLRKIAIRKLNPATTTLKPQEISSPRILNIIILPVRIPV